MIWPELYADYHVIRTATEPFNILVTFARELNKYKEILYNYNSLL